MRVSDICEDIENKLLNVSVVVMDRKKSITLLYFLAFAKGNINISSLCSITQKPTIRIQCILHTRTCISFALKSKYELLSSCVLNVEFKYSQIKQSSSHFIQLLHVNVKSWRGEKLKKNSLKIIFIEKFRTCLLCR